MILSFKMATDMLPTKQKLTGSEIAESKFKHVEDKEPCGPCEVHREVFRNRVTAVEVIVKSTPRRLTSKHEALPHTRGTSSDSSAASLSRVVEELWTQCLAADRREMEARNQLLMLSLENEKLKVLLESKSKTNRKLRRDLAHLQSIAKQTAISISENADEIIIESGLDINGDNNASKYSLEPINREEKDYSQGECLDETVSAEFCSQW